jgi:hypothetical protein
MLNLYQEYLLNFYNSISFRQDMDSDELIRNKDRDENRTMTEIKNDCFFTLDYINADNILSEYIPIIVS